MSLLNNDLNIFYFGGSGGFYLLHYLLLFKQHWCVFEYPQTLQHIVDHGLQAQKDQLRLSSTDYSQCADPAWPCYDEYNRLYPDIAEPAKSELEILHKQWANNVDHIDQGFDTKLKLIFDQQWSISNVSDWKQGEIWPINSNTLAGLSPRPYKIYFTCASKETVRWPEYPGKKILIYTDIKSQLRLAGSKKAHWFNSGQQPTITQIKKFIRQSFKANGQRINSKLQPYFDTADYTICLQDLIARPELVLGAAVTDQHRQFTQHWKNCHPASLLEKTGLN